MQRSLAVPRLALRSPQWRLRSSVHRHQARRRPYSTTEPPPPKPTPAAAESSASSPASDASVAKALSRFDRFNARLPKFLQRYTSAIRSAPASQVISFIVLHEITAIVPLLGFGWYFYSAENLPWFVQGAAFDEGVQRMGKWFRKRGWLGREEQEKLNKIEMERGQSEGLDAKPERRFSSWWKKEDDDTLAGPTRRARWWERGENGIRLVTSLAASWAITKALLPLRLMLSVWGTPFFARTVVTPVMKGVTRLPVIRSIVGFIKRS